jgi:hypothetical protein
MSATTLGLERPGTRMVSAPASDSPTWRT